MHKKIKMAEIKEKEVVQEVQNTSGTIQQTVDSNDFYTKNKKNLNTVGIAVLIMIAGYFLYQNFVAKPKIIEAEKMLWTAEKYFEQDSFKLALNGSMENPGLLEIIDNYGSTPSGNLAKLYAGLSYLQLGEYDLAIEFLQKYSSSDPMLEPLYNGALGDAFVEKNDLESAVKYYQKAIEIKNSFLGPIYISKAALVYENLGKYEEALEVYKKLKNEYPESEQSRNVDKYISKFEVLAKK